MNFFTMVGLGALVATGAACDAEHAEPQGAQATAQSAIPMPDDQREFIDELSSIDVKANAQLRATGNDIRRDAIRNEQEKAQCRALRRHRVVHNWVARLQRVSADSFAPGFASIELVAGNVEIQSEPSLGDKKGLPPISWVKDMEPGQLVTFSGTIDLDLEHAPDRTDCNPVVANPIYIAFKSMKPGR
jgi:hypothetical protein